MRGPRSRLASFLLVASLIFLVACDSVEERADAHYESALEFLKEGDIPRATVEFRNVFKLVPNHREARTELANALIKDGREQDAYPEFLRLVEYYPDDFDARVVLARLAFLGRSWEEFDRHSAEVLRLAPDAPETAPIALAAAYRDAFQNDETAKRSGIIVQAEELLEELQEDEILTRLLIDGYSLDQRYSEALGLIDTLLADNPEGSDLYSQKLAILGQIGATKAIEETLLTMVERFPDNNDVKSTLIRFYLSRDQVDDAEIFLRSIASPADEDPALWLSLIQFLERLRGTDAALVAIEEGIAQSPSPETFRAMRAGLTFLQGETDAAIAEMETLIADMSEDSENLNDLKMNLARMYMTVNNEIGARRLTEEVLADSPINGPALKMQAAWAINADNTDQAIEQLRLAIDTDPNDSQAMTMMAQAYTRTGQQNLVEDFLALAVDASNNAPEETIRYARVLLDDQRYLPAEDLLLKALSFAPQNFDLLSLLGNLYVAKKDTGRLRQVLDALETTDVPNAQATINRFTAALREIENGSEAAAAFIEELAANSEELGPQMTLLQLRLATGETESAIGIAEELVKKNPDNPLPKFALAAAKVANGDIEAGIEEYRALVEENPTRPRVWLQLAGALRLAGEAGEAIQALEDGLAANPADTTLLWTQASILELRGRYDEAIGIYEQLYETNSGSTVIANNLASLLSVYRNDAESLDRAWTVARRLRGTDNPAMQDTYGWLLHQRGDAEEALAYLESAAAGLPNDPIVQFHLGEVYNALGQNDNALTQYTKASTLAGPLDKRAQIEKARKVIEEGLAPAPVEE